MPKKQQQSKTPVPGFRHVETKGSLSEYLLLKNGLRVLYMHVPGSQTVTTNVVYNVGSRHEQKGKTGIAHMFEHMMFKPTHDGTGKKQAEIGHVTLQHKGALLNATTWIDRTNYFFQLPPSYLPLMLKTEADRMRNLVIEEKEFLPERKNVLSEYEMGEGDPLEALDKLMNGQAFYSHGYGHSTIGFKGDIESYTRQDLVDFYNTYYWPNNATMVIVGDVDLKTALTEVRRSFGKLPRSPHPIDDTSLVEPPQEGERRVSLTRESPLNIFALGYRAPRFTDRDWAVAEVLLEYLTDGPASVLHEKLIDTHLASTITPMLIPSHDPNLLLFYVYIAKGVTHQAVEDVLRSVIHDIHTKKVPVAALKRCITKLVTAEKYRRDGTLSIANQLTECIAAGDWTRYYSVLDDIASVTPADIQKFAKTYLRDECAILGTFHGKQTVSV